MLEDADQIQLFPFTDKERRLGACPRMQIQIMAEEGLVPI